MFQTAYCGYQTHNPNYDVINRPNGIGEYLFLLILAPMRFYFDDQITIANPGACILFAPHHPQHYEAQKEFVNSFAHFTCDPEDLQGFSFPVNSLFYPQNVDALNYILRDVFYEYLTQPLHYQEKTDSLFRQLLIEVDRHSQSPVNATHTGSTLCNEFSALRLQLLIRCHREWTSEEMCSMLNIEKSQFYSYYRSFFNTTPKADLIHARIDRAKHLLANEDLPINQIAVLCGFNNIYHFNRYFKKTCGCTPSEYTLRAQKNR